MVSKVTDTRVIIGLGQRSGTETVVGGNIVYRIPEYRTEN